MECPYCKEMILEGARVCKHCGKDQPAEKSRKRKPWLWALAIVGALIVAMVVLGNNDNVELANCARGLEASGAYQAGSAEWVCANEAKQAVEHQSQ